MNRTGWLFGLAAVSLVVLLGCNSKSKETSAKVNVSGVIKDHNGNPLANTTVMFNGPTVANVTTDEKGRFSKIESQEGGDDSESGLEPGPYEVRATGNYGTLIARIEVKAGEKNLEIQMNLVRPDDPP